MRVGTRVCGFTLVEMLVVGILMAIIVSAVAVIFSGTTRLVDDATAQHAVTQAARNAFDRMSFDFYGALSYNTGSQRFVMQNGVIIPTSGAISYQSPGAETGPHHMEAADRVIIRTNTTVGPSSGLYEVVYELEPDPDPQRKKGLISQRYIFTLMRRARQKMPAEAMSGAWTGVLPTGSATLTAHPAPTTLYTGAVPPATGIFTNHVAGAVCCEETAHYILSFNLEYGANTLNFSQLQNPSPHPFADPLGNGTGANDTPGMNPYRIAYIRVTMIVVDSRGERNQRVLSRVITIPMG